MKPPTAVCCGYWITSLNSWPETVAIRLIVVSSKPLIEAAARN